jgi:ferredoxin
VESTVHRAPNTFDQDDDTVAIVIDQHGDPEDKIRTAIISCPARAISLAENPVGSENP